jgi:hypothetical protein
MLVHICENSDVSTKFNRDPIYRILKKSTENPFRFLDLFYTWTDRHVDGLILIDALWGYEHNKIGSYSTAGVICSQTSL